MKAQIEKDIKLKGEGRANPHWHFEHDPRLASEMTPLLNRMKEGGIPWTYGNKTPF